MKERKNDGVKTCEDVKTRYDKHGELSSKGEWKEGTKE